jgi:uncharacterized RDD family membrane protein YckC
MQYASFGARFLAFLLDVVVFFVLSEIFDLFLRLARIFGNSSDASFIGTSFLFSIVISWLYTALYESSAKQGTLGKQALGIVVTDLNGDRISFARATGRYFASYLSSCILLIGYFMAAFTERKQALHDLIASTLVVKK